MAAWFDWDVSSRRRLLICWMSSTPLPARKPNCRGLSHTLVHRPRRSAEIRATIFDPTERRLMPRHVCLLCLSPFRFHRGMIGDDDARWPRSRPLMRLLLIQHLTCCTPALLDNSKNTGQQFVTGHFEVFGDKSVFPWCFSGVHVAYNTQVFFPCGCLADVRGLFPWFNVLPNRICYVACTLLYGGEVVFPSFRNLRASGHLSAAIPRPTSYFLAKGFNNLKHVSYVWGGEGAISFFRLFGQPGDFPLLESLCFLLSGLL